MWMTVASACALSIALGACGSSAPPDPPTEHHLGGQVRGLWDGTAGIALHLQADRVDTQLTVAASGSFQFDPVLASGTSYTVTIATNPTQHQCIIDTGSTGTIADADTTNLSIICTGPPVTVAFSGAWGWTFDPTEDTQTFVGSLFLRDVALTISGSNVTGASIHGVSTPPGAQSSPIALSLGTTTVPITLTAQGNLSKTYQLVFDRASAVLDQVAYCKASNPDAGDNVGFTVSLSGDTLAVGAPREDSAATGVNGNQADDSAGSAGAVFVFVRSGTTWTQQAYLKASNAEAGDYFGSSISLSGDTLAIGAPREDSAATGVEGDQADDSTSSAGAAYVFVRSGTTWTQQAYLKASNTGPYDSFGFSLSLSGDTLAVGAFGEDSTATGVEGDQANEGASSSGAAYIFVRSGTTWTQQAYLKASNTGSNDFFGSSLSLSDDALAVGAYGESSAATGVNGNQADESATAAGAVYVFSRGGATWTQQAYLKASNTGTNDFFGSSVSLFGDALAVGAFNESSAATGVDGDQADNSANSAGAVYVFGRSGATWTQQAYLKASNTKVGVVFGRSVSLSDDMLAVGAENESSAATGVNSNQADNSASEAGAVYVFGRNGATWTQQAYLKASNTGSNDFFGSSVSLSGDALAVGAYGESSATPGINGNETDNTATAAGAVYLYR